MERVTKRIDEKHICYAICEKECPDGICADNQACMCTASKMAMRRLLYYEDTGLTPEEIRELKERDKSKPVIYQVQGDERYEQEPELWMCPNCEEAYDVDEDYAFCPNCGQRLLI